MDEHKEKRINIQRTTHDDVERCHVDSIPLDIILEILSRLPAKSIVRFLCVSKLWSSFTKLPSFIKTFTTHSSARPASLVAILSAKWKRFVFLFPQQENPDGSYPPVYSYEMTHNCMFGNAKSECVKGLVLLDGFVIWNQSMRRFLKLPELKTSNEVVYFSEGMTFLGYDPVEGKHKVLFVYRKHSKVAWIHTLGDQEAWRMISNPSLFHFTWGSESGRCFNGILYQRALSTDNFSDDLIMSFDVRSEKFKPIKFPEGHNARKIYSTIPYEGRIALVPPRISSVDKFHLNILTHEDGHEWTHKQFVLPTYRDKTQGRTYLCFCGVTDAAELIFVPEVQGSFYILYFDPKRNSIREAVFEGPIGEELRRHYGNNSSIRCVKVFPNHIESLVMSL